VKPKIHQVPLIQTKRAPPTLDVVWDEDERIFAFVVAERGVVNKRTLIKMEADYAASVARFLLECLQGPSRTRPFPPLPTEEKK